MALTVKNIVEYVGNLGINVFGDPQNVIHGVVQYRASEKMEPGVFYVAPIEIVKSVPRYLNIAYIPSHKIDDTIRKVRNLLQVDYRRSAELLHLHSAIARDASSEEVAAICRNILGNPVWILNAQMDPLAYSVCDAKIPSHHRPKEFIRRISASPEIQEADSTCPCRRIIGKICAKNRVIGFLLMLNIEDTYGDIQEISYINDTCTALAAWDQLTTVKSPHSSSSEFLIDLLEEKITDSSIIHQRMQQFNFPRHEKYYILAIDRTPQEQMSPMQSEISYLLHQNVSIYGRYYLALVGCRKNEKLNQLDYENLISFLSARKMSVGLSNSFSDLSMVSNAFHQSIECFKIKSLFHDENPVFLCYEDLVIPHLLRIAEAHDLSLISLCASSVVDLLSYDRQNNTEYVKTLAAFLFNQLSLKDSADKLYVHRNTVYKRIQWMQENYGIAFNNQWEIIKLQMTLFIIEHLGLLNLNTLVDTSILNPTESEI